MYVSARIIRNSLLCSFIFASASTFQIANADRTITYTVPSKNAVYGLAGGDAEIPSQRVPEKWSVNSRKVRTTGYGAAASATASRSSYGFVGRMTVSRAFFQAWLAYEIGSIGLEWIRQQYAEKENAIFDPKTLMYIQKIPTQGYICGEGCEYTADIVGCESNNSITSLNCALSKINYSGNTNKRITSVNCENNQCIADFVYVWEDGAEQIAGRVRSYPVGDESKISSWTGYIENNLPAGEPTIDPDPYLTAAILDQWAHIVPEMRQRVSDNVDFLPNPQRYKEIDPQGNVLQDYEGVLEPMEEPIANPHKTAKRPEPEIEPTPQLKTKNLLNGNEITQPTEPLKEPTTQTNTSTNPQEKVDLSKIEDAVTKIGAEPADTPIPKLELNEWGEIEIPTPEATDAEILEQAGKIRKTVTAEQVIQKANDLIEMHNFNYETFGNSSACPPPRKMRFLTVEFDLPFDMYCDYIKQIVLLMIGLIPLGVFIYFLRNLFIHG